jgi:hypothetical protein
MFTITDREKLRSALISAARSDGRVAAAATLGSAAVGHTDGLSDIDLALGLTPGLQVEPVLEDWSRAMYELPAPLLARAAGSLVGSLEPEVLWRALAVLSELLLEEAGELDDALAARLEPVLRELAAARPEA